jgi:hypothetical protein
MKRPPSKRTDLARYAMLRWRLTTGCSGRSAARPAAEPKRYAFKPILFTAWDGSTATV